MKLSFKKLCHGPFVYHPQQFSLSILYFFFKFYLNKLKNIEDIFFYLSIVVSLAWQVTTGGTYAGKNKMLTYKVIKIKGAESRNLSKLKQ